MKRIFFCFFLVMGLQGYGQISWPAVDSIARPWTRWWWMGSAVDTANLRRNMERYRAVGLGGLELTPIYGVRGYEDRFVDYLSPKWMELLSYTLGEARRLGLGLDLSNGTGWPFGGGPLIDSMYACKEMFYRRWEISEGIAFGDTIQYIQTPLIHTDGRVKPAIGDLVQPVFANKARQDLALDQVRFGGALRLEVLMGYRVGADSGAGGAEGELRGAVDLTGMVDAHGGLHWVPPAGSGKWVLYGVFSGAHGKMVERAAPGAEGNVIDHFSRLALGKYLSRFDTAFMGRSLGGLRAFFNDSYEVDDSRGQSNWTPGFFETFRRLRGYDLREHLRALFEGEGRVLSDYRETISDLLLAEFTRPWGDWAHGRGRMIRNQAHGAPANILDLYAASDIPETEGEDPLRFAFARSAAHVTGKRLVSAEAVTWQNEHFLTTMGDVRKAADQYFLAGVNHLVYHGTAYSPDGDPWPGWLFYAAVHFTPNDPSWTHFHALNEYIARCQSFLQQGDADNDVLLYYPLYDSWAGKGPDLLKHYDRMEPEFSGTGFKVCADSMLRGGYAFDYVSDGQIQNEVHVGRYKTIVLPDARRISVGAFTRLVRLAGEGATVVVYKQLPGDVPGFADWQRRLDTLRKLEGTIAFDDAGGFQEAAVGKGRFLMGDNLSALLDAAGARREKMVAAGLSVVRRRYHDGYLYFIVNNTARVWDGPVALHAAFKTAALFNPMTGAKGLAKLVEGEVLLQLEPGESMLVRTYDGVKTGERYAYYTAAGGVSTISGKWRVAFESGGPVLPAAAVMASLRSWTLLGADAARFSGTGVYTLHFSRPGVAAAAWQLDLGRVDVTAEVWLNGQRLGVLIGTPYKIIVPGAVMRATNVLEVRVCNLMANRIIDMDKRGVGWKKFYNTNFPAHDRANRGPDGLFDASGWAPLASGLEGPVRLTPLKEGAGQRKAIGVRERVRTGRAEDLAWTRLVGARVLPIGEKHGDVWMVNDYGAIGDGVTLATKGIQAAIDSCTKSGGGVVMFRPGVYVTGSLFVKDGVELRVDSGVELRASVDFKDYPEIDTRIAGIEMKWPAALLNMIGIKRAAITGRGRVNAQGKFCWDKYWAMRKDYDARGLRWIVDYDAKRVRTLLIQESSDITIRDLRISNSGFWTVQVVYSDHVTVDGIVIRNNEDGHGPSTDGVDIDSSTWVLVEHCDIDCNDDDFCLKAGRDWDGLRVNRPTEYVVIRHCVARKGGGLLTIGSETSGSIRHVLACDLYAKGTGNGFHIKSATTRGGTVEDIHLRDIRMDSVGNAVLFTMNWNPAYSYSKLPDGMNADRVPDHWKKLLHRVEPAERGIPHFQDIEVSGLWVTAARKAVLATGLDASLISRVKFKDSEIHAQAAGALSFVKDWDLSGLRIFAADEVGLKVKN